MGILQGSNLHYHNHIIHHEEEHPKYERYTFEYFHLMSNSFWLLYPCHQEQLMEDHHHQMILNFRKISNKPMILKIQQIKLTSKHPIFIPHCLFHSILIQCNDQVFSVKYFLNSNKLQVYETLKDL